MLAAAKGPYVGVSAAQDTPRAECRWHFQTNHESVCTGREVENGPVLFANRYRILGVQLARIGCAKSAQAGRMFSLADRTPNFTDLARGVGIAATSCPTTARFEAALAADLKGCGPSVTEAVVS